jgi:hypothetical protein
MPLGRGMVRRVTVVSVDSMQMVASSTVDRLVYSWSLATRMGRPTPAVVGRRRKAADGDKWERYSVDTAEMDAPVSTRARAGTPLTKTATRSRVLSMASETMAHRGSTEVGAAGKDRKRSLAAYT